MKSWIAVASALAVHAAFVQTAVPSRREITVSTQPVPLSDADPGVTKTGSMSYLGGLVLRSDDERFGGLSGLVADFDGGMVRLIAVTDQGERFAATLALRNGRPQAIENASIAPLIGPEGRGIVGKGLGDAESLTRLPDGRLLAGFERRHRVWSFGPGLNGPATPFETPLALKDAPSNGGLESLASWPDGRVLAITEQQKTPSGNIAAYLHQGGSWSAIEWRPSDPGFEPSDASVTPDGDLLILERYYSPLQPLSVVSRVVRVRGASVRTGAILQGDVVGELKTPLIIENFEGISAFKGPDGATWVALVSDDNLNGIQRTLLLLFDLRRPPTS